MAKPSTSLLKRRLDIAEIVRKKGEIKVDDLAEMLAVSGVTIRNDLNYLEQQGYLKRSFGGAIYTAQQNSAAPARAAQISGGDKALEAEIARQLAALASGSESIFLDAGSLLRKTLPYMAEREATKLIFNDLRHVALVREFHSGESVLLGGRLSPSGDVTEGEEGAVALREHAPDLALIALEHVAEDGAISVRDASRAALLTAALESSRRAVAVIADRPVYGEMRFVVGHLAQLAGVVTPQIVAAEYHSRLQQAGLSNSYTNNECLTWLNPALPQVK
ncbi:DeoR/GlpR family DNA-binding transcription regulator [uncultured Pluralibacter sp.]|uniref:DeoR/GlpR family DNA-binding transcription regulator n=1 Tax=uncultured Pluralibacter sp. TaxID=1490864 RepID=UPI002630645F|nr:DeoR/GlpR family DNA-binding transcription regulator [uncultured Pluralibacter sp.]